ncbi:hypothetical protein FSP39_008966 [Pinctada imbricata]|uniref:Receptor ligand binding region domain-containing protein n=1 Tax=Pinctada imbricata TaxID=66713 RepID=A0AA88XF39_PINIB|nr:hypothetical protein FSP39_008966 [Pinctada imbricata]
MANAERSIMFGHLPMNITKFQDYLRTKYPTSYDDNPWFKEYYQRYFSCNLDENWMYNSQCTDPSRRSIVDNNFRDEYTTLSTIHAVEAMAKAVHSTLQLKCGVNYNGVCSKFLTDVDTPAKIRGYLDSNHIFDVLDEMFHFYERELDKGINIYYYESFYALYVIHTFESIGETGREEFSRLAYLNRICIAQNITVGKEGPVTNARAQVALQQLFVHPDASIVVLFVDDPLPFLQEIEKSASIRNAFKFVGTDKWGEDPDVWDGLPNIMADKNVVTFDVETADITGFDKYLEYKTPNTYTFNPWFNEYYEYIYNCSLTGQNSQVPPCPSKQYGIPRSPNYIQDPYVLYVINAVFSAAIGAHNALFKLCPPPVNSLCNLFATSGERRQEILNGAKLANFTDDTKQPFYFTPSGESDRGYHIWQSLERPSGNGYYLEDVGSYNDTHYLKIDARYDPGWRSPCDGVASCNCTFPSYIPSRYMLQPSP